MESEPQIHRVNYAQQVLAVMAGLPSEKQAEVLDFARFLEEHLSQELTTEEITLASLAALKDWFTPEEDKAWEYLADMVAAKS